VELNSYEVRSREGHLVQCWLPLSQLPACDLRPHVVRDATVDGTWETRKHIAVPFAWPADPDSRETPLGEQGGPGRRGWMQKSEIEAAEPRKNAPRLCWLLRQGATCRLVLCASRIALDGR
jgi:hypothetical protein